MSQTELQRVNTDLATMKSVLGDDPPYDRADAMVQFWAAGAGAIWAGLELAELRGFVRPVMLCYTVMLSVYLVPQFRKMRERRAERPRRWRTFRAETIGSLVATPLLIGYVLWISLVVHPGETWDHRAWLLMLAAPIALFSGSLAMGSAIADHTYLHRLGWGVALIPAGFILTFCENRIQSAVVFGSAAIIGGLSAGLILLWQLRRLETTRGD